MAKIKKSKLSAIPHYEEYKASREDKDEAEKSASPSKSSGNTEKAKTPTIKKNKLDNIRGYNEYKARQTNKTQTTQTTPTTQKSNRRSFNDIYSEMGAAEDRVKGYQNDIDSWLSKYGATSDNIMDTLASKYGAQKDETGTYTFSDQNALDEFNRVTSELTALYDKYNSGISSYNDLYNQANTYDLKAAASEMDALKEKLKEAERAKNYASLALHTANTATSPAEFVRLKKEYDAAEAAYEEVSALVVALNQDIKGAEYFQDSVYYNDYLNKDGVANYSTKLTPNQSEYMTDDELRIYNYLYEKEGAQAAVDYMDHLKESLNYREGTERGENIRNIDNDVGRFLATGAHGVWSGLENFGRGIGQLFTEEQLATSPTQYASSYIVNDLHENGKEFLGTGKTLGELGYEGASVVSNMAPSILVGALTGGIGGAALGSAIGSTTMGLSAAGNAYTQAMNEGYTEGQARNYGALVGASEGALQYLLGGISKLSGAGNLTNKALSKVASIENGLLRASAAAGIKAGGEIVEEELQNFLEPLYRKILFNEEYDAPTTEEIVYTAVLTFLTTGVIESTDIASYASNKPAKIGAEFREMGDDAVQAVIEEGLASAPETESYKLASAAKAKMDAGETVTDREIGLVYNANVRDIDAETKEAAQEAVVQAQTQDMREVYSEPDTVPTSNQTARRTAVKPNYGEHGTATFNSIVETNTNADPVELMVRFDTPYQAGLTGLPMKQANLVNDFQIEAYNAGHLDYIQNMANDKKKAPGVVLSEAESGFDHANAPSDMTQEYKDFSNWFAKKLGVKGSWDGKNGDAAYNAFFDKDTGGVTFAQDFGINPSLMKKLGSMDYMEKVDSLSATRDESFIFYVGHEMAGHVAKERAPKQMRAFFNSMYNYLQDQTGNENLARSKQAFYSSHNVKLDTEAAIEEVGSDSILMLYDGDEKKFMDAMRRVYDSLDEDAKKGARTYLEVLKDYIKKLKAWVRKLTGKENAEARANAEKGISELEKLRDMFESAIAESMKAVKEARTTKRDGKLFRTTEADGTVILETSVGNPVAMMTEDGSALFSLKTYDDFGRAELKRWLTLKESKGQITKEESADILKQLDEYYDLCQKFIDKYAPFGAWSKAEVVRDNKGKPVFSVVKANGEYAMNLDFSLVCKKRRTLDAVFKEMIDRGIMDDLSLEEADIAKVNEIIRSNGFETACALCFVDSKRYRQAKVADTFVNQYNEIVRQLLPEDGSARAHHFDFVESGVYKDRGVGLHTLTNEQLKPGIEKLKQIMRENGKQTVAHKIAKHLLNTPADRKLMSRSDFMNTDGFGAVKVKNPAVLKLYNSSKGAGGPKAAFSDVQYLGEILKKNNFTPERAYAVGGVRIQSFSDYIPRLVFDYLQMVADLSAKKLPAHAYTKEAIFVKQFGMTGIKMNMSLVPAVAEDGIAPGLDKNGDYFWFDGQSFGSDVKIKGSGKTGFELAVQIQNTPGYSQHCGTVAVGVSHEHIMKMLDDDRIRMIIPYHKSSLNHIVAVMNNIDKYTDYTNVQNTRNKSDGKKISGKDFNFNVALRKTGDAKAAANEYLEWCEKNDYIPKFDEFAGHENYYKVLEDFSTYDNGVAAPQGAVTMTFPKKGDAFGSMAELIEQGLEEDAILEADREKSVPKIVDQVEQALQKKDDKKYSLKSDLTEEQQKNYSYNQKQTVTGSTLKTLKGSPIKRSKFGVGKEIGGTVYLHKDYATDVVPTETYREAVSILEQSRPDFQYNAVMWNPKTGAVRFDEAPDFDIAREPVVGDTVTVNPETGAVKDGHSDYIWHHKWVWVKNDYKGFDVDAAWKWSKEWLSTLPVVSDGNGIGRWNAQLDAYGLPRDSDAAPTTMYSLKEVAPVQPTSDKWQRGHTEAWFVQQGFPLYRDVSEEQAAANAETGQATRGGKHGTQITSTKQTYEQLFKTIQIEHPDDWQNLRVLDASSGLGLGTRIGRDMGFNVTDIEPFPSENDYMYDKAEDGAKNPHPGKFHPDYTDYSLLQSEVANGETEGFDYIISNAVLNVIPQDTRDNLVDAMGSLLKPGGQMFINVISRNYDGATNSKPEIQRNAKGVPTGAVRTAEGDYSTGGNVTGRGHETFVWKSNSVQKVFSYNELVAYLEDALGGGYTVVPYKKLGMTAAMVTKGEQFGISEKFSLKIDTEGLPHDAEQESKDVVSALKRDAMLSRYGSRKYASYTNERIEAELSESLAEGVSDYAHSYIAWVDPIDFLHATTATASYRERIRSESGKLRLDDLRANAEPIYLIVNEKTGEVVGHEGRHRMTALMDAGIDRVAVIVRVTDRKMLIGVHGDKGNGNLLFPRQDLRVKGQQFDTIRGANISLHNLLPLSWRYADAARELFSEVGGSTTFSLKGERAMRNEIKRIRENGKKAGKTDAQIEREVAAVVDPEYGELLKVYGEIKRGERPARDIVVPQRTEKNRHVSQTIRTALEAEVTPDAAVPTIQELIAQGEFSYERITDKAALAEAENTIRYKGFETAMADWLSEVSKGIVSKANTAMGWSLYNAAATKGDLKTAMTILNGMVQHQRSAAQALQATRILKKMTPDAQLYGIQRSVESINEELRKRHSKNKNDADNVPVELWMQKTGELLADQIGKAVKKKTRKEKTVCQRVLADLRKLARETVTPATMPADTRTEMDSIYDMFHNKEQYEKALAAAKETVAKEYGNKPEIMDALDKWMSTAFDYTAQFTKEFTGQTEIQIPTELADKFLSQTDQEGRDAVAREIYRYIGSQMPSRFIDKWNAWRYLAMLGNPRTHVRNVVGNLGFAPVVAAKNMTAGAIESAVSFVTGGKIERNKGIVNRKLLQAAWADYDNVADEVSSGGKYNDSANRNKYIEEGRTVFKFKPLEKARKGNSAALEKEDIWFARPHYAFALAQYCKAHGVTVDQLKRGKALGNARAYAIKEAQKATYKDTNAFSEFISKLGRYHGDNKVAQAASFVTEGILPFRKTPANILVRGLEYSPVGLLKSMTFDLRKVQKGDMTAAEAIDNISAGLTGTGLLGFGLWAAAEGLIRGAGGGDDEEKKFEELQGHQTYALELPNGKSITLDWLAPEVLPMFIGVNLYETATENNGESNLADMLNAISNVTEPLLEMSCLQSLNDLFDNIGYATTGGLSALPKALASAATSYLTQAFPTILGQFERSAQDVRMTTYTEKDSFMTSDLQYTLGKVSAKIPGWDFQQIPYIDAWGRTESSGSKAANAANNFLNPAYMSQIETSAMEEELQRLYDETGIKGVLPDRASKYFTVDGERKDLTAEEYVAYATEKGQLSYDMLTDLISRSEYGSMNDEERAEAVEMTMKYADAYAKTTMSDYEPTGWIADAMNASKYADMDETDYLLYKVALSAVDKQNTSGTVGSIDNMDKAEAIASMSGFTDKDIAYLWDTEEGYELLDAGIDMSSYVEYVGAGHNINAEKLIDLHNNGVAEETYYDFLDTLKEYDQPTKSGKLGSYTQAEAAAAIAAMPGLSREERALLWQSVNKGWSSKKNPWR